MRFLLFAVLCLFFFVSPAQQNFKLGYSEFPTIVNGQATDQQGNLHYVGHFKGVLTVNDSALATGQGLDDIFWVKTSPTGKVLQHKVFASPNTDISMVDGLTMGANEQLYFISSSQDDLQFGDTLTKAYTQPNGGKSMNTVCRMDTAGVVKWVKRTNLNLLRVYSAKNMVHVIGRIAVLSGSVRVENETILDSVGKAGFVHLMYDTAGHFLNHKLITGSDRFNGFALQQFFGYSDGSLLYSFLFRGTGGFYVNGNWVSSPASFSQYQYLLKVDTSYNVIKAKNLNPGRHQIWGDGITMLPADLAKTDSLYAVLCPQLTNFYSIDGNAIAQDDNRLVVFDSNLNLVRTASLGNAVVAPYSALYTKRKFYFRSIRTGDDQLYFTGQYLGTNESPNPSSVPVMKPVHMLGINAGAVDENGPSQSFVARTALGIHHSHVTWIGDHTAYEWSGVYSNFLHLENNRLAFVMNRDNVWNPWVLDTSLAVVTGSMKPNADWPEEPRAVSFFPDGSKLVLTYASGRTMIDTSASIVSNSLRRDLFFASFNPDGSLRWHNRIKTTLPQPTIRKFLMKNGKVWCLAMMTGSQNDSNYIAINNQHYTTDVRSSLLLSIEADGKMTPLNLLNEIYKYGTIQDFSFFSNGDLALVIKGDYPFSLPGFSTERGLYLLRVSATNGAVLDTRKLLSAYPAEAYGFEIEVNNGIYLYMRTFSASFPDSHLYLQAPDRSIDTILIGKNAPGEMHATLLHMTWDSFKWAKRSYGEASITLALHDYNQFFLLNNRPVISIKPGWDNRPLYWEDQLISNNLSLTNPTFVMLDEAGRYVHSRTIPFSGNHFVRKKTEGEELYVSGSISGPEKIDTIQLAHAGATDAVAIVLDSTLTAKKAYRFSSPFSEYMYDMDIYKDSVAAFVYSAQTAPAFSTYRTQTLTSDYDPDAFVATMLLSPGSVLPAKWLRFTAQKQGISAALLKWELAAPLDKGSFVVESSPDNQLFYPIGVVAASAGQSLYSFSHQSPLLGKTNYYRIQQLDKEGRRSYSPVKAVQFAVSYPFAVSPNPARDKVVVQTPFEEVILSLFDNSGRRVLTKLLTGNQKELDLSGVGSGTYLLVAESGQTLAGRTLLIKQ